MKESPVSSTTPRTSGRDRILAAALHLFSRYGFSRITTDRIAREAGVSQAYVVRAFGSKTKLIRILCEQASTHIEELFRDTAPLSDPGQRKEFSRRFQDLAFTSDELRLLAQLFVCGTDDRLGPLARDGFARVSHLLHDDLGIPRDETRSILAIGMLATTLSALDYDRPADPLIEYLFTGENAASDDSDDSADPVAGDHRPS
ncbi:TetR/AcrR family transcriptional regulator [Actinomyces viscosus]|uniref:TetR/AcrR family transcriptional regulator n=1 Tax=Actinomyces viscosus TaxID=1656 RepID=UPI0028E818F2|nr:TetR/AcrR family transcriptional regulator [Actinomyces viscosus]